jgi:hypothetical protein
MQFVQRDYYDFSYKCQLQLKISCMDQLQNDHFLLVYFCFDISSL